MQHIHDELTYLSHDQLIFLNDKYLSEYLKLSLEELKALLYEFETLLDLIGEDEEIEEEIKISKNKTIKLSIRRVHLYKIKINCLYELINRKKGARYE